MYLHVRIEGPMTFQLPQGGGVGLSFSSLILYLCCIADHVVLFPVCDERQMQVLYGSGVHLYLKTNN
jgi:hypothetical protein